MILNIILITLVIICLLLITFRKEKFASAGGALIQLAAKDPQDSYLIGGPRPYLPYFPYYYPTWYYPDYPYY